VVSRKHLYECLESTSSDLEAERSWIVYLSHLEEVARPQATRVRGRQKILNRAATALNSVPHLALRATLFRRRGKGKKGIAALS
jgi:hypothetical protein